MPVIFMITGFFIGSFLGVIVDRITKNKTIVKGRSCCDECKKKLIWKDLVPIFSFLLIKGKCRYCKTSLSPFYPIIEFITGVCFLISAQFIFSKHQSAIEIYNLKFMMDLIFYLYIVSVLIIIFFIDLKYGIIPDKILFPAVLITLIFNILNSYDQILNMFFSAIGASLFFLFLILITKGKGMGYGDVKFVFLIGLLLGFPNIVFSLYLAFLTGGIVSIILILCRRKKFQKDTIPFGPFLSFSTFLCLFWGDLIIKTALRLLNL